MEAVGIRELKQNASAVVRRVAEGEDVVVSDRGRPVARMVPLYSSPMEDLILRGLIDQAVAEVESLPDPIESSLGVSAGSDALSQLREDERY